MSLVYRQPPSPPGYPRWSHRPAGMLAWQDERCGQCRKQIDSATEATFKLWINPTTSDSRLTRCGTCAEAA